ncbi:hypothetical protein ACQ7B2_24845, partial [Escherichia coli]
IPARGNTLERAAETSGTLTFRRPRTEMLSKQDNELLTQVGPGTPIGELFRRFWLPALLS